MGPCGGGAGVSVAALAGASLPPGVKGIELAFQLLEFLASFAQFTLRGQSLIVFEILCSVVDERIEIIRLRAGLC
jgi:hypothetical protein